MKMAALSAVVFAGLAVGAGSDTGAKRIPSEGSQKVLVAFSLDAGAIAWKYPQIGV
jgi:hypothetical protein